MRSIDRGSRDLDELIWLSIPLASFRVLVESTLSLLALSFLTQNFLALRGLAGSALVNCLAKSDSILTNGPLGDLDLAVGGRC
mgnify:CR=1 FL=1